MTSGLLKGHSGSRVEIVVVPARTEKRGSAATRFDLTGGHTRSRGET